MLVDGYGERYTGRTWLARLSETKESPVKVRNFRLLHKGDAAVVIGDEVAAPTGLASRFTRVWTRIERELVDCSDEQRAYFKTVAFEPMKWTQSHGDEGGGFWAIAADSNRVLWYNDIEDGFNVSTFTEWGTIPANEYWCNQDELRYALPALMGRQMSKTGPPEPLGPK